MTTVAFLGLGNMGAPMATNLVKGGIDVRGYDPVPAAAEHAAAAGVAVCASVAEAASGADVVITMLPAGPHVLGCYGPGGGIVESAKPGALLIDCSTIEIDDARTAHRLATESGFRAIDAPVSGGVVGATAGTLTFMVGGDSADVAAAEPLLSVMGRRTVHCGEAGAGQAAKVCNNLMLGIEMIAVCEAFVLAESLGLDQQALFDVASTSSGQCWALTTNCPVAGPVPTSPANNDYQGGFATALMLKDLRLADAAARLGGVDTAFGRAALATYEALAEQNPTADFSSVINAIRDRRRPND